MLTMKENTCFRALALLFVLLSGITTYPLTAQNDRNLKGAVRPATTSTTAFSGTTRALIVGISNYQNDQITDLQFADRDAEAFAQYLQSPAGGSVDPKNITLLLNEQATMGQFANGLDWLLAESAAGDRAIIYFSGHGDVEQKLLMQPGFLLCWDAPARVYTSGGAYGLYYLQGYIATLSVENKTSVVLITDACHAGKLAGEGIGGTQITATNLAKQVGEEVKILSCQADQLSLEGREWGEGRGVFSYFLIRGMTGLADRNGDGKVSLLEIERYLEDEVPNAVSPHVQLPQTIGNKMAPVAWVDRSALEQLQHGPSPGQSEPLLASIDPRAVETALLADRDSSTLFQFRQFKKALKDGRLLFPEDEAAYTFYEQLKDRPTMQPFLGVMRRNLAASLQDEAQQAINDYLSAEPAELDRRWTYDNRYEHFPEYLERAAEVLGQDHPLYKDLMARAHYFAGLNLRLTGEQKDDTSYYYLGLKRQQQALELAPTAAYAYNELGVLHRRLGQFKTAIQDFGKAQEYAPMWVLPWANLTAVYNDMNDYDLALTCGHRAEEIQASFPLVQYNLGVAYREMAKFPEAKSYFQKTIKQDPKYADAYYNLGWIYYHQDFDLEAAQLMFSKYCDFKPDDPAGHNKMGEIYIQMGAPEKGLLCYQKALALDPDFPDARLGIAVSYLKTKKFGDATAAFDRYIAMKPNDPWGLYFFALLKAEQQQWGETLRYLEQACVNGFAYKGQFDTDFAPFLDMLSKQPEYAHIMGRCFPTD
ncbi:MAG: tetratricopeptide repeat protein [Bacteroidetes bacterium]|nr:MAG: tetratricopeptide repeat protein [Bacteroidota bacterium]